MSGFYYALTAAIAAVGAALLVKFIDRLRKKDVETEAQQILEKAKQESENLKKEALLEAKEEALRQKTEAERDLSKQRDEIREREKSLDRGKNRSTNNRLTCESKRIWSRRHSGD